ncbi:hypothetical protein, partial [Paraburkholderia tropica]|uniref:hypothetical protein n=1 Tax=Paraburkholderia tropica TaxID=92647 RepID=UPI002AB5F5D9
LSQTARICARSTSRASPLSASTIAELLWCFTRDPLIPTSLRLLPTASTTLGDDDVDSLFREIVDDSQALHAPAVGKCVHHEID